MSQFWEGKSDEIHIQLYAYRLVLHVCYVPILSHQPISGYQPQYNQWKSLPKWHPNRNQQPGQYSSEADRQILTVKTSPKKTMTGFLSFREFAEPSDSHPKKIFQRRRFDHGF